MDYHQYKHEETSSNITTTNGTSGGGGGGAESKSSSFLCRQSSTRWIPTGEQVRILRDLYYNCGVRSPSAEQIQKISSRLRQYGKIEGKNVFYWFQNHKARERQKRRLTVDVPGSTSASSTPKLSPVVSGPCSSPGLYGGGSVLMERSFGDSFIYGGGGGDGCSFDPAAAPWMCHYAVAAEQEMAAAGSREIETLPLFPIYSQEQEQEEECGGHFHPTATAAGGGGGYSWRSHQTGGYFPAFYLGGGGGLHHEEEDGSGSSASAAAAASLELSLSSYYCAPPGST